MRARLPCAYFSPLPPFIKWAPTALRRTLASPCRFRGVFLEEGSFGAEASVPAVAVGQVVSRGRLMEEARRLGLAQASAQVASAGPAGASVASPGSAEQAAVFAAARALGGLSAEQEAQQAAGAGASAARLTHSMQDPVDDWPKRSKEN